MQREWRRRRGVSAAVEKEARRRGGRARLEEEGRIDGL